MRRNGLRNTPNHRCLVKESGDHKMEKDKPIPWTVDLLENPIHWQLQGGKKTSLDRPSVDDSEEYNHYVILGEISTFPSVVLI